MATLSSNSFKDLIQSSSTPVPEKETVPSQTIEVKEKDSGKNDIINLENINLSFSMPDGKKKVVFENFNLNIEDFQNEPQFISIMGQSGCGKSTILNMIAGLQEPDQGFIKINGESLKDDQSVPLIFQNYSSYPWRNVFDNVVIPLEIQKVPKKEREEKTWQMLRLVGLEEHAFKYPNQLSGGQKQRVAIGRSLNCNSRILLLDEASSGLDIKMKREFQDILVDLCYNYPDLDRTFINVGHNIEENVYMSNRIYILTANPCTIYKIIDINFDRRTPDIRKSDKFHRYVDDIDTIMNEVCK